MTTPGSATTTSLSSREVEVLAQLAAGRTSEQVAEVLNLSVHTVVRHVANMQNRLGAPNRVWLIARAYASGVLSAGMWPPQASGERRMAPGQH